MKKLLRPIYGMANFQKRDINEKFDLWMDEAGKARQVSHSHTARLKVESNGVELSIIFTRDGNAQIVNPKGKFNDKIKQFQHQNDAVSFVNKFAEPLFLHYNKEITTTELAILLHHVIKQGHTIADELSELFPL